MKVSRISRFSLDGKKLQDWTTTFLNCCADITFDPESRSLYLLPVEGFTIYNLNTATGKFTQFVDIVDPEASSLVSIDIDRQRRELYVSDNNGAILQLQGSQPHIRRVLSMSAPEAVAVDVGRHRLYIGSANRVLKVDLDYLSGSPKPFIGKHPLKNLKAMVVDKGGNVWIADPDERAVLCFSPEGRLLHVTAAAKH